MYSAQDISDVSGIPLSALNTLIRRGQFVPETGRNGRESPIEFTGRDALQAVVVLALRAAGVPPRRYQMFWQCIGHRPDIRDLRLYVLERADGSDTDFKFAVTPERPADVPDTATLIDVGDLLEQTIANLEILEVRRLTSSAGEYPFRQPFVSPVADAPWQVFVARRAGEPDAEMVATIADAFEARRNLLVVSKDAEAFRSLCDAVPRVLNATTAATEGVSVHFS